MVIFLKTSVDYPEFHKTWSENTSDMIPTAEYHPFTSDTEWLRLRDMNKIIALRTIPSSTLNLMHALHSYANELATRFVYQRVAVA